MLFCLTQKEERKLLWLEGNVIINVSHIFQTSQFHCEYNHGKYNQVKALSLIAAT